MSSSVVLKKSNETISGTIQDCYWEKVATQGWVNERLGSNSSLCYEAIFKNLCKENPERENEFLVLLKMYNWQYRTVVILIESENLKREMEHLKNEF